MLIDWQVLGQKPSYTEIYMVGPMFDFTSGQGDPFVPSTGGPGGPGAEEVSPTDVATLTTIV